MARPRSARAHDQVLAAALELFAARGIDATSMDAIAEASGVSKATIYNHWADKDALCLEALAHLLDQDQPPAPDSGDVRADLVALLTQQPPHQCSELRARIMPQLMAYAIRNPLFAKAWRERVFEPPRVRVAQLLDRAVAEGLLPRDLDRDLALALLLGPMMYCHVLTRLHGRTPENIAERVVAAFWSAQAIPSPVPPCPPRPRRLSRP